MRTSSEQLPIGSGRPTLMSAYSRVERERPIALFAERPKLP